MLFHVQKGVTFVKNSGIIAKITAAKPSCLIFPLPINKIAPYKYRLPQNIPNQRRSLLPIITSKADK